MRLKCVNAYNSPSVLYNCTQEVMAWKAQEPQGGLTKHLAQS